MTTHTSISTSAVLVEVHISVWTANLIDRKVTDELLVGKNAVTGAAQVKKNLMAGTSERKDIADYAAGCRLWHNQRTMPWADKGQRLLPTSLYMEYKQELNQRKENFTDMVTNFLANYDNLVSIAQNYMGDLFNADDYPSADAIADKFGFQYVFSPIPQSGDFRLDIPAQELEEVKAGYEDSFNDRLQDAMKDPWNRLHKLLAGMSSKLNDDGEKKKRFHDSFVDNAVDLCEVLKHMNLTNDPKLEEARRQLQSTMQGRHIEVIKEDQHERSELKRDLDNILGGFDW